MDRVGDGSTKSKLLLVVRAVPGQKGQTRARHSICFAAGKFKPPQVGGLDWQTWPSRRRRCWRRRMAWDGRRRRWWPPHARSRAMRRDGLISDVSQGSIRDAASSLLLLLLLIHRCNHFVVVAVARTPFSLFSPSTLPACGRPRTAAQHRNAPWQPQLPSLLSRSRAKLDPIGRAPASLLRLRRAVRGTLPSPPTLGWCRCWLTAPNVHALTHAHGRARLRLLLLLSASHERLEPGTTPRRLAPPLRLRLRLRGSAVTSVDGRVGVWFGGLTTCSRRGMQRSAD